jgi:hypothetical protein
VKFQLDDLCHAETDSSIRKVLQNLPRNLGETYDRLLTRIDNAEQREYVKRMFMWIICARRPLGIEELREAIAFTIEDDHFDHTKIPNDLNRLARACGNLIVIDDNENSVQIAHYTVEQHLLKEDGCKPPLLHFTRAQANIEVGKVCVGYLSFSDFELQLTQYEDTTTSNLAALEDVVRTQSMLPPNSQTAKLVKTLKWFRGSPETSTNIQFDRYVAGGLKRRKPAVSLKSKYRLLSYVAENWLQHNTIIGNVSQSHPWSPRHLCLFENLVLAQRGSFDMRPWDSIPLQCLGFPFVLQIGWALSTNNLPLLRTISKNTREGVIGDYLEHATNAFVKFSSTSSGDDLQSLREFSGRSTEIWPNSGDWECWLYHCVVKASDQSFTDVLEFCFSGWAQHPALTTFGTHSLQTTFVGCLLLDAVIRSANSVVEVLTKIVLTWPVGMRRELWAATKITDTPSKALEMAFLSKSEHLMDLLASIGFEASALFKERLLLGSSLLEALKSTDVENVRCFLRIFGATKASLSNIERYIHETSGSTHDADARILEFLVDSATNSTSSGARPFESHWIWTLGDRSIEDQINVLLAAGVYLYTFHDSTQGRRLLFDTIIEDKPIRLDLLLQNGMNISSQWGLVTDKQVNLLTQIHQLSRTCILNERYLSPLCFAVLYDRNHMIERLLAGGGYVDGNRPDRELAPIHFAAMLDSLESFKCLESHGADLSQTDGKGRDMMYYLLGDNPRRELDKSLLHYLVEHRNSYLQYSWSSNPAFINRKV